MPELGRDPVELLTNNHVIEERWLSNKIMAMVTGGSGFIIACYTNYALRKPVFSGKFL